MSVNLSIKNAPDDIVRRLRQRAERNHRSLQGELMAIIETAVADEDACTPIEFSLKCAGSDSLPPAKRST